jgi:DNA polymerase/3'-5' exonuclease PolX
MTGRTKFQRSDALAVARALVGQLRPKDAAERCERVIVAGSLRRRKKEVGDVEILFIPRWVSADVDNLTARLRKLEPRVKRPRTASAKTRPASTAPATTMKGPK